MSTASSKDRPAQRIMALWFPHLPAQRVLRQRLGRSWRSSRSTHPPLVVSHRDGNAQTIFALDERAAALGLRVGMGIADARAMHSAIDVVEQDADADRRLLAALADWCDRYTPLVALEETEGLFLDITGCAHLFGGECALRQDVLNRFFHQGFAVACGIASTPGAAWASSRFGQDKPIAGVETGIVEPGHEEALIAPLPLAALRLDASTRAGLESVGLRKVGALLSTPRAPLVRRFGRHVVLRLDQALGAIEEAISPRLPVPPLSVERGFAEPIMRIEEIEALVLALAVVLKRDLERRGEGARLLDLLLFRVDGHVGRITVGASRPLREPRLIQKLFREKLAVAAENLDAGFGFDLIRLAASAVARFDAAQADLVGDDDTDDGGLAMFADRIQARLGNGVAVTAIPVQSHLPERAVALRPLTAAIASGEVGKRQAAPLTPDLRERPIRLLEPAERVDVTAAEVPEGPPSRFRWRRAAYAVARAEGPERIAPEWWRTDKSAETRDYFRVEDAAGRRYWLYREGFYGAADAPPRWYMHGLFA